ncbi:S8 family serine peptidase [Phormidesmis priestleyi]
MATFPHLKSLWDISLGDPSICIAVLDGLVDLSHPCFDKANLARLPTLVTGAADRGSASQHGTHVTSIIFGQHDSPVLGIAPHCRGLIVPVFAGESDGDLIPCSQIDLARAIERVVAGLEKKSRVLNETEKKIVAYHEVGHALVGALMTGSGQVEKISIVPRGMAALGYTLQLPNNFRPKIAF